MVTEIAWTVIYNKLLFKKSNGAAQIMGFFSKIVCNCKEEYPFMPDALMDVALCGSANNLHLFGSHINNASVRRRKV